MGAKTSVAEICFSNCVFCLCFRVSNVISRESIEEIMLSMSVTSQNHNDCDMAGQNLAHPGHIGRDGQFSVPFFSKLKDHGSAR